MRRADSGRGWRRDSGARHRRDLHRGVSIGRHRAAAWPRGARRRGDVGAVTGRRTARAQERRARRPDVERGLVPHRSPVGAHSDGDQPGGESDLRVARGADSHAHACSSTASAATSGRGSASPCPSDAGDVARARCDGRCSTTPEGLPAHLERVLVVLETLRNRLPTADAELKMLAHEDARMRRLMTVPGVGPVTAARFVAALDDVDRFPNAASVASYLGLVPGENTTGFRTKRTRLTRAGVAASALGAGASRLVAVSAPPARPDGRSGPSRSPRGAGRQVAIMALARKLAHVLYAMWKHETTYDPARGARPVAA